MIKNGEFPITDTPLAAYLIQQGFKLIIIRYEPRPNSRPQGIFIFNDSLELQEHIALFESGEATINLVKYEHAKSKLIDRIMRGLP